MKKQKRKSAAHRSAGNVNRRQQYSLSTSVFSPNGIHANTIIARNVVAGTQTNLLYNGFPISNNDLPAPVFHLPYPHNRFFSGREAELQYIYEYFTQINTTTQIRHLAITGLGGIGKTQIMVEYAHQHQQEYQYISWINAASHNTLIDGFITLAGLLQLPSITEADQQVIVAVVKNWLNTHDSWLLLLDNADDPAILANFLPTGGRGHLLLTSRYPAWNSLAASLEVKELSEVDGIRFLLHRINLLPSYDSPLDKISVADQQMASTIVRELDGLPLALDQAGAYIEGNVCLLETYLKAYQKRAADLLHQRGRVPTNHPDPVDTTWSLNFEQVAHLNPAAADLLSFLAFLAPDAIPEKLLLEGINELGPNFQPIANDETLLDEVLGVLRRFSLIQRNADLHLLYIHRLVQFMIREHLTVEEQYQWMQRAVASVNAAFPFVVFAQWPVCERYLPHALLCNQWIVQKQIVSDEAVGLLSRAGDYLRERARYTEAEPLLQRALTICEQQLGIEHPITSICLSNLALFYVNQGKYAEAEPLYRRALAICEQQLGPEHPSIANCLSNLASLYARLGKYAEAEPLYRQALAICERQLEPEHPDIASHLSNLANLYEKQGKYIEAEPLYRRALAICEQQLESEHPDTATILNNLANLYEIQGRYTEAEPLYRQALDIREKQLGTQHPRTLTSLSSLAFLYMRQGKYAGAESLARRALAINGQQLETEPNTVDALNNLAMICERQGKDSEAESTYQRALTICEQQLGPEHPLTATVLHNLAAFYMKHQRYAGVEILLKRALSIDQKVHGLEHLEVAADLNSLAMFYRAQKQYTAAMPLLQQALIIEERQLGLDHPLTATSIENLALLYMEQGEYAIALPLLQRALIVKEQQLGSEHLDVARNLENLAHLYQLQGHDEKAEPLYQRALAISERVLGPAHLYQHMKLRELMR